MLTKTTYVPSPCPVKPTQPCSALIDYVYRAFRGLPAVVEQFAEALPGGPGPQHVSTLVTTFEYTNLYRGSDGRGVRQLWAAQTDLYLWGSQDAGTTAQVPVVIPRGEAGLSISIGVTTPGKGSTHLRRARQLDVFGSEVQSIDFGVVGTDTPIRIERDWNLIPFEPSGWQYRATEQRHGYSDMSGQTMTGAVRRTHFDYNTRGLLQQVSAPLTGTLPLTRHNTSGGVAAAPSDASADSPPTVLIARSTIGYDPWGNVTSVAEPNGRCTGVTYDGAFQELPENTANYRSGCGSANPLVTSRHFDRGFEVVTNELSPAHELTITKIDGFGRVIEVDQPDATLSGFPSTLPAVVVDYSDAVHGPVRKILTQRILSGNGRDAYASSWTYLDGFGRTLATLSSSEVQNRWIVNGLTNRSSNGRVIQAFESFAFVGTGNSFQVAVDQSASQRSVRVRYDESGRVTATSDLGGGNGGGPETRRSYNATNLSVTVLDAEQVPGGHHGGSTTVMADGHGRAKQSVRHVENPTRDDIVTTNTFLATGELDTAVQSHSANPADRVVRQQQHDSFGRLVQTSEPNTGLWRYAYNDVGDLVGTSDPRGCGENLVYDGLGRLVAEDYSPCTNTQTSYSLPDPGTGDGYEAVYSFDRPEVSVGVEDVAFIGRLAAVADRAQHTRVVRDARGRVVAVQRQLAKPDSAALPLAARYTPNWFSRTMGYDEGNRPIQTSTGTDAPELQVAGHSDVTTSFTPRGAVDFVGGSYGALVSQTVNDDGSLKQRVLGDVASTTTDYNYYPNGRLQEFHVHRAPGAHNGAWLATSSTYSPPTGSDHTLEAELADQTFTYDLVGNPTQITDATAPGPWQTGSLPVSARGMKYDDEYRLTRTDLAYAGGDDAFRSPYFAEETAGNTTFPALAPVLTGNRVRWQSSDYDWLGNIRNTDDDAHDFPDRSTGVAALGTGPHQLTGATGAGGSLKAIYDAAGNVVDLFVQRTTGCTAHCTTNYIYDWDELGRLSLAFRVETEPTAQVVAAALRFEYDASGNRILEKTLDTKSGAIAYNATIFDSLRLEHATYPDANGDYEHTARTESVYLNAADGSPIARVLSAPGLPTGPSGSQHVFFELGDHLGSTSFVIDRDTSEVVERATYQSFGGAESDFRPSRWNSFRETYRYTSHEDDAQVGLVYFGQRYYSPTIGRWVSPDPLNVHALRSDPNPYAFVRGSPLAKVDPVGLDTYGCDNLNPSCALSGLSPEALAGAISDWWGRLGGSGGPGGVGNSRGASGSSVVVPPPPPPAVTATPFRPYANVGGFSGWLNTSTGWFAEQLRDDANWRDLQIGCALMADVAGGIASGGALWYLGGAGALTGIGILGNTAPGGIGTAAGVGAAGAGTGTLVTAGGGSLLARALAIIDPNKFKYLFGKVADGDPHNIARSLQNAGQLARVGVYDNAEGRDVLSQHFSQAVQGTANIVSSYSTQYGSYQIRESVFFGPGGALSFRSTWEVVSDGVYRFVTAIPFGGGN